MVTAIMVILYIMLLYIVKAIMEQIHIVILHFRIMVDLYYEVVV